MPSTLLASATVLPRPVIASIARNFFMICSGVCRVFFILSLATLRVADSHNTWFGFWGALHGVLSNKKINAPIGARAGYPSRAATAELTRRFG